MQHIKAATEALNIYTIDVETSGDFLWPRALSCYVIRLECSSTGSPLAGNLCICGFFVYPPFEFLPETFKVMDGAINYIITFSESYLLLSAGLSELVARKSLQFERDGSGVQLSNTQSEEISIVVKMLLCESKSECPDSHFLNCYLHLLLLFIRRYENHFGDKLRESQASLTNKFSFARFRALLEQQVLNVNDRNVLDRSVKSIAQQLHLHPNYLNQIVKKVTGHTVQQEIRLYILGVAKTLLTSELSIKEISNLLLFREAAHFTSFFKKNVGHSPREYRKAHSRYAINTRGAEISSSSS